MLRGMFSEWDIGGRGGVGGFHRRQEKGMCYEMYWTEMNFLDTTEKN